MHVALQKKCENNFDSTDVLLVQLVGLWNTTQTGIKHNAPCDTDAKNKTGDLPGMWRKDYGIQRGQESQAKSKFIDFFVSANQEREN